jgi:LysM repeat protein
MSDETPEVVEVVEEVAEEAPKPTKTTKPKTVVVTAKDTWGSLAERYKIDANELAENNRTTIKESLTAGTVLKV